MNAGALFYLIALVIFFLAGIGTGIPNPLVWGLTCLTLGLMLSGVSIPTLNRT